jgi:hypothetical protein
MYCLPLVELLTELFAANAPDLHHKLQYNAREQCGALSSRPLPDEGAQRG